MNQTFALFRPEDGIHLASGTKKNDTLNKKSAFCLQTAFFFLGYIYIWCVVVCKIIALPRRPHRIYTQARKKWVANKNALFYSSPTIGKGGHIVLVWG